MDACLRRFLSALFSLLPLLPLAQVADTRQCGKFDPFFITSMVEVARSSKSISFNEIRLAGSPAFQKIDNQRVVFAGYDTDYYWFRFVVKNPETIARNLILLLGPLGMREAELFQGHGGHWQSKGKTGIRYAFDKRPYQSAHYTFPVTMKPASLDTFYLRMDFGQRYRIYAFVLMRDKAFKAFENRLYFHYGIIIGILLLFFAINVYLFLSIREKIHLWYSLYILMMIFFVMINDELSEQFFGFDSERAYKLTSIMALGAGTIAILMHVVHHFLENVPPTGWLSRITTAIKYNLLLAAIVHLTFFNLQPGLAWEEAAFYWADISTLLGIATILINCIYSLYLGFRPALFFIIGLAIFFVGATERLLLVDTTSYLFPPNVFHLGIVLETVIISFGLIDRYRVDRQEKLLLLKEKDQLRVHSEKRLLEYRLQVQEQTFKHISQEIHDNFGQYLTLAKLNLNDVDHSNPGRMEQQVTESVIILRKVLQEAQILSKSLHEDVKLDKGLHEIIANELQNLQRLSRHETSLSVAGEEYRLDYQKEFTLFRIFQEMINNIIKHAGARNISVYLSYHPKALVLEVHDDGTGFDFAAIAGSHSPMNGLGIRNMEQRTRSIGGTFLISSHPGTGTTISVRVDVADRA